MRYYVVSDVHDHYDVLIKVLREKEFDENNKTHKLIICGDAFTHGDQPGELFEYLKRLYSKNSLIFIFGNHDLELVKSIENRKLNKLNRKTLLNLLSFYNIENDLLSDDEICLKSEEIGVRNFIENSTVPYFETDKYIFVHGYIPTAKNQYIKDWRNSSLNQFKNSTMSDAMVLSLKHRVIEETKVIVAGHYSAARGHIMKNATEDDWNNKKYKKTNNLPTKYYEPFYSDDLILIDGNVYKTGIINCLTIDTL